MACVAPDFASATNTTTDSQPQPPSALLQGFNKAITAVTVCHTGGSANPTTRRFSTGDLAKIADHEAQKGMSMLASRMTVSKAIIDDVEVLSMLVDRIFS